MSADWDVLGLGVVAVDDIYYLDRYPAPDSKEPVRAHLRAGGGLVATALVAAARLGARAAYAGVLGDDELSRDALAELEREGVDCTPVLRLPDARPVHSIILVDRSTGQRCILPSFEGATARAPSDVLPELIARCRVLLLDHSTGAGGVRAADLAHDRGIPVVADIEAYAAQGLDDLLKRVDHLIVGLAVAQQLSGRADPVEALRGLTAGGRACTVVTMGDTGGWFSVQGGAAQHYGAYPVTAVDTTGCGDVFHGAYAAALARGEAIEQAIRMASATAALKATRTGGRAGIPDTQGIERFMAEHAHDR
jgi:sugar/nucleoside kinase (ribokinase family)